jgi:hypothetical protein
VPKTAALIAGDHEQYALHPPRPIAIERDADRQLHGRER